MIKIDLDKISKNELATILIEKDKEIERLNNIIKEVREYIYRNAYDEKRKEVIEDLWVNEIKDILEILDKGE